MSVYRDIYAALAPFQDGIRLNSHGPEFRLIKLQEEVGEVAQAYIGVVGANKRKGVTHQAEDVAKELADVVVTAMVALHDWTEEPSRFVVEHFENLLERIKEEGS